MSLLKPRSTWALIAVLNLIALAAPCAADSPSADFGTSSSSFSGSDSALYVGPPLDAGPEPATNPTLGGPSTPEPSTLVMLVAVAGFAAFRIRRRRR